MKNPSTSRRTKVIIVAHGGTGSPLTLKDGTDKAAREALKAFKKTGSVLEAAVAGVMSMEDDPRFNAGTGSYLRLDGKSIEMDAAVMDSNGALGAVAVIQRVKNPVKVAYALVGSPHTFLSGKGATDFARLKGFPDYDPSTQKAIKLYAKRMRQMKTNKLPQWITQKWEEKKNLRFLKAYLKGVHDTVGVVARDGKNNFAVADSTGGTSFMLSGRIGDTPLVGCGFYAGPFGAVASTGIGEEITKKMLAREIYQKMAERFSAQHACEWGVKLYPKEMPIGVIAVSLDGYGIASNQQMAATAIVK
ncbi:MAG: isoaspartyl peptidase/L-asparaginase [Planctomycetes bacterium]|nr:isoaspartyl peptidase/L-asparaginase [Planctomycetota bacterium]